ncbi:MAG TPA: hypothetical protein PLP21_15395 [Pyrinomonadaceae bacterium]|nr:hypothetical protein [Acidobacteriota bacterium]HQZ97706.1 hypothetical protein [Pyrinomonadaceae bacterium]
MESKRRPFWLPASNYYVLSVAISIAFFFVVWGILHDGGEETPWITAGISSCILVCGAVILREVILRRARNRLLMQQRMMENRVKSAQLRSQINEPRHSNKITLERNAVLLNEIRQKSEAAKLLSRFSSSHREVFEMCGEYISLNENELKTVNPNSPRLAPLLKGRSAVAEYHRYHLLKWAEIEARTLSAEAQNRSRTADKVEAAQNALGVIDTALQYYPLEKSLIESREVLQEMIVSIKVSNWIERAERAAFKGDTQKAKSLYRDALFYLGRDNIENAWREEIAIRIDREIENLNQVENNGADLGK